MVAARGADPRSVLSEPSPASTSNREKPHNSAQRNIFPDYPDQSRKHADYPTTMALAPQAEKDQTAEALLPALAVIFPDCYLPLLNASPPRLNTPLRETGTTS